MPMTHPARIVLTGGTGFIGTALASALSRRGDDVVILSRRGPVGWDALEREVDRAHAVIHLAGEPIAAGRWTSQRIERIRSSRLQTTDRVARAVARARPSVLVSASAVGIYGMRRDNTVCDEESPSGEDTLARIVKDWEAAAHPAAEAGVRVVHPRLGVVLGQGGALARMRRPFEWFVGGPIGGGRQWLSWVHVRDVVAALLFALDSDGIRGPVNVVAPEPATMNEFARSLASALGRPSWLRVPEAALRAALGEGLAEVLLTGQRVVPRKLLQAGFVFQFPHLPQALRDLR